MEALERDNVPLKAVLPKNYARPRLDKQQLFELIGLGDAENRSKDLLGCVYEYFLSEFASAEGKKGASSTPSPAAWSGYWSRCWRPTVRRQRGADLRPLLRQRRDVRTE